MELAVDLTSKEADRSCLNMGCAAVIDEINERCHVSCFSLVNPMIRQSLEVCMAKMLDFGTAYAYFRSVVMAARVNVCTFRRPCQMRDYILTPTSCPPIPYYRGDRPSASGVRCIFEFLPDINPYTGMLAYKDGIFDDEEEYSEHERLGDTRGGSLWYPYHRMPRRMWDLAARRVVMARIIEREHYSCDTCNGSGRFDAHCERPGKMVVDFWAISHAWLAEQDRHFIWTKLNGYQWEVPIPKQVSMEKITEEVKILIASHYDSNATNAESRRNDYYCWLDVLCLRQEWPAEPTLNRQRREAEWEVDVPTIGNIYICGVGTVRYFNGLGKRFKACGWDSNRHWLNRAWTLQEIKSERKTETGGVHWKFYKPSSADDPTNFLIPLHTIGVYGQRTTALKTLIQPLIKIAKDAEKGSCSILELFNEMRRRFAVNDRDKVAGINYLLHCDRLPIYQVSEDASVAWSRSIKELPVSAALELLFNFPLCGRVAHVSWAPSWDQIVNTPQHDELLPIPPAKVPNTKFITCDNQFEATIDGALLMAGIILYTGCYVLSNCMIQHVQVDGTGVQEYIVRGNDGTWISLPKSNHHF